jgi:hypothetical protein
MRLRVGLLVAALCVPSTAAAQAPPAEPAEAPAPEAPAASAEVADPAKPPLPTPPKSVKARGTAIVAVGPASLAARALARRAYQESALRPSIDEATAAVLTGGDPPEGDAKLAELASTIASLSSVGPEARRRLASSIAADLGVERLVLVEQTDQGPRARVVEGNRYLGVVLAADDDLDWSDAVAMLRGLSAGTPEPGPRSRSPQPVPAPAPLPAIPPEVPPPDDGEYDLLTNPWFWSGIGLVLSVGVTVLVLSQTALNEPDMVRLEGTVGP